MKPKTYRVIDHATNRARIVAAEDGDHAVSKFYELSGLENRGVTFQRTPELDDMAHRSELWHLPFVLDTYTGEAGIEPTWLRGRSFEVRELLTRTEAKGRVPAPRGGFQSPWYAVVRPQGSQHDVVVLAWSARG